MKIEFTGNEREQLMKLQYCVITQYQNIYALLHQTLLAGVEESRNFNR